MSLSSVSKTTREGGFTLIEIMISMAILVFITFGIYQAMTQTFKLREVLSVEGDFYNGIRLAMSIVQKDIAMIYTPTLGRLASPSNQANQDQTQGQGQFQGQGQAQGDDELFQAYTYWGPALDATGLRPSRLTGTEQKLTFISLSHLRIYKDSPESEMAKISYEIQRDETQKDQEVYVLVKTESPNVFSFDERKDTFSRSYPILRGIKKFKFTYYQKDGNTWKTHRSWDTTNEDLRNIYPSIIEISLEAIGGKNQTFEGTFKFRPELPLNGLKAKI